MTNNSITKAGYIEYKMPTAMAKELIKSAKFKDGIDSKRGQEYLCDIINTQYGLKGECVRVTFF